jgi:SAM-dependent methyltransferase
MAHTVNRKLNARHSDDALGYEQMRDTWLNRRRLAYVSSVLASVPSGGHVLEIGAGTGYLLIDLAEIRPDLEFTGVEPLPNYVELASLRAKERGRTNVNFVEGFAETMEDLAGPKLSAVLSNDTLHHVSDQARTCQALARLAEKGATWLAIEPSVLNPYVAVRHTVEHGERNFHPGRFIKAASEAGWAEIARRYLFAIPPALREPPPWMRAVESKVERFPVIAGGVALVLVRQ